MISISTRPIFDGVLVLMNDQELGEVRIMRDGVQWNAVPFDDRPTKVFDEPGRAVSYLISGW